MQRVGGQAPQPMGGTLSRQQQQQQPWPHMQGHQPPSRAWLFSSQHLVADSWHLGPVGCILYLLLLPRLWRKDREGRGDQWGLDHWDASLQRPHPIPGLFDSWRASGLHPAVRDLKTTDFLTHLPLIPLMFGPLFPGDTAGSRGQSA